MQEQIFWESEGDAWFQRNREEILKDNHDWTLHLLDMLDIFSMEEIEIKKVIELGCANGWRLNKLYSKWKNLQCVGVDASIEAIEDGKERYPNINLYHGLLSQIPLEEEFDLCIVSFVFHWIDRQTLARSIAEIDRLIIDGGFLVVSDFLPDFPQKRHYHHLPTEKVYTYKQDYMRIFEALGTYKQIAHFTFNHDHRRLKIQLSESSERGVCAVLQKSLNNFYLEV